MITSPSQGTSKEDLLLEELVGIVGRSIEVVRYKEHFRVQLSLPKYAFPFLGDQTIWVEGKTYSELVHNLSIRIHQLLEKEMWGAVAHEAKARQAAERLKNLME